jgi:hypothetical protein
METVRDKHRESKTPGSGFQASNDNRRKPLSFGCSLFPEDAAARIFRPCRSVMTAGTARIKGWRLVFERRIPPFIEPFMGYTGGTDTLIQVELEFPTLEAAIRYAERQSLTYVVQQPSQAAAQAKQKAGRRSDQPPRAFSDATLERLGLSALQESNGQALAGAVKGNDASDTVTWSLSAGHRPRSNPVARSEALDPNELGLDGICDRPVDEQRHPGEQSAVAPL